MLKTPKKVLGSIALLLVLATGGFVGGSVLEANSKDAPRASAATVATAPTSLTCTSPTATSAKLTWKAPTSAGTSPIERYDIRDKATAVTKTTTPSVLTYTWTGLTAKSYTFQVRAITSAGAGAWAECTIVVGSTATPTPTPSVTPTPTPTATATPTPTPTATPTGTLTGTKYVSTTGADTNAGTSAAPYRTIQYAMSHVVAGDVLIVRAGTYTADITNPTLAKGTATNPITIRGEEGAKLVGLVRLSAPSYWVWDNVDVTWKTGAASTEHMFRITGGAGWKVINSEIYGAHSYAALHITGAPTDWLVSGNYFHDTYASNSTNQDHLIYFSDGTDQGIIERNIFAHSPNGRGIKVGSAGSALTNNVVIRYNTFLDNTGPSNVQLSYYTSGVQIYRNIMQTSSAQNITSFTLSGTGNVAHDNIGYDSTGVVDTSDTGLADTGGNLYRNPLLDATFHPQDATSQAYGRYAP